MIEKLFNKGWLFKDINDENLEEVSIPHTPKIEELNVSKNYQSTFEYKNTFKVDNVYPGQRVFIYFEAVMTNCKVFINDILKKEHFGGYLPFCIDITDIVSYEKENKILVIVDNHDDPQTPPGKPTEDLDFLYYGGIYRNVKIIIKPQIYLTDAFDASVKLGGTYIETDILESKAKIKVRENIKSFLGKDKNINVSFKIIKDRKIIKEASQEKVVPPYDDIVIDAELEIDNPELWDTNSPNLYELKTEITFDSIKDTRTTVFGIRSITVNENGLYLNNKKIHLFGLNRGQQYPYIGIAASDEAHRREARLLKESGINCLRLAHYPHSPAFIDECDKLGILVIDPVPGWQFRGNKLWQARLKENLKDLVRRDRNHPCVCIFEVTPNETNWADEEGDKFLKELNDIVKAESPKALTGGDTVGRYDSLVPNFDIPYSGEDVVRSPNDNRLQLKREYGDWRFGGNKSSSRCSRCDGEKAMQIQTWNFQYDHNDNYRENDCVGDLIWEAIDHNRGYYPDDPISKSGIYDIFRIKKLSYQFVRSQKEPKSKDDFVIFMQALTFKDKKKLVFYSNCDELELYSNNTLISKRRCDCGEDKLFNEDEAKLINDNYWMTDEDHVTTSEKPCYLALHTRSCLFDGGNCKHIEYPPFTFNNIDFSNADSLTVKGYHNGKIVKTVVFNNASKASHLEIVPQIFGVPLKSNNNDFIFINVNAVDSKRNIDTGFNEMITLNVTGGTLIGHKSICAEIGTAGFMIKADEGVKSVELTATSNSLIGKTSIDVQ